MDCAAADNGDKLKQDSSTKKQTAGTDSFWLESRVMCSQELQMCLHAPGGDAERSTGASPDVPGSSETMQEQVEQVHPCTNLTVHT